MAVGGTAALTGGSMSRSRLISLLNFGAVLVHQYEEYQDPGWFPGQFKKGVFRSDDPARYPLNTNSALCVNTAFAYPFYLAPVLSPRPSGSASPRWCSAYPRPSRTGSSSR